MAVKEAWKEDKHTLKDNIKVDFNINRTYRRGLISLSYCRILWRGEWNFGVYKNDDRVMQLSGYLLIKSGVHLSEWVRKIRYNMAIVRNVFFYKDTTTTTRQLRLNTLRWHILTHWGRGHLNCLNARSRGLNNLNQLLYCVSLNIYNKFANYFCELKVSGNTHQRP